MGQGAQAGIYENALKDVLEEAGHIIVRSAGSHGRGDLVMVFPPPQEGILIEVKASKYRSLVPDNNPDKMSGLRQWDELVRLEKLQYNVWYAYWLKRQKGVDGWRFFRPSEATGGGKRGGRAFQWEKGRTIHRWLQEALHRG